MKLAIIDLDGVVANSDARFDRARQADDRINWKIAFDPELIPLDVPVPGAADALSFLERKGYLVCFLTSRPEPMRAATAAWLMLHGFYRDNREIFMKPIAAQYTKTVEWKMSMVATSLHIKFYSEVLFIDDEEVNRAAVEALGAKNVVCKADLSDYMDSDKPLIF